MDPEKTKVLKKKQYSQARLKQNPPITARLAKNLYDIRLKKKITQVRMAKEAGIFPLEYVNIEDCRPQAIVVTLFLVDEFAKTLGVDPQELLKPVVL